MNDTSHDKLVFEEPHMTTGKSVEELSEALFHSYQELEQLNKKLVAQEVERSEFYANISHDLRSPMATISGSIEYLLSLDHIDEKELRSTLSIIQTRSKFMEQMINDIFTLSSLNFSSKNINLEPVEMGFFLEDFFYDCAEDIKYRGRVLRMRVPMELECICNIDPKLIRRVLDNLFTNALKYSNSGDNIVLSADLEDSQLHISVEDTGIGIASENLEKIFDRSFRVDNARTPGFTASAGFGLAIAKSIMDRHQGKIWCESVLHEGSVFHLTLPIADQ